MHNLGPKNWGSLPGAYKTTNECGSSTYTPLNIIPDEAVVIEVRILSHFFKLGTGIGAIGNYCIALFK